MSGTAQAYWRFDLTWSEMHDGQRRDCVHPQAFATREAAERARADRLLLGWVRDHMFSCDVGDVYCATTRQLPVTADPPLSRATNAERMRDLARQLADIGERP